MDRLDFSLLMDGSSDDILIHPITCWHVEVMTLTALRDRLGIVSMTNRRRTQ